MDMYERFTDRARKVMQLANQEAQRFNHEYIGTEHILLGIVKEGTGSAACVLKNLSVDLRSIRLEVERIVQSVPGDVTMGKLPQTPRAKKVIEFAMEEARNLKHNWVGTEHLLLGLLRECDGVGALVLKTLCVDADKVRGEVLNAIGKRNIADAPEEKVESHTFRIEVDSVIDRARLAFQVLQTVPHNLSDLDGQGLRKLAIESIAAVLKRGE